MVTSFVLYAMQNKQKRVKQSKRIGQKIHTQSSIVMEC
jgi:hypothetical protein